MYNSLDMHSFNSRWGQTLDQIGLLALVVRNEGALLAAGRGHIKGAIHPLRSAIKLEGGIITSREKLRGCRDTLHRISSSTIELCGLFCYILRHQMLSLAMEKRFV